jgi:hypothetical protein
MRRDSEHQPTSVKALALALGSEAWSEIAWREGSTDCLASRFARVRVQAAHRDYWLNEPRPQEWLLIEWPHGEKEPTKYWLSTLPEDIGFERMVELAKLRWRIERDYQDLKQDLGLGHYEGRGWLPPSCQLVHRGLWLPDRRTGENSPLGICDHEAPGDWTSRPYSTPRRPRSDRSGMCPTPSPRCEGDSL